MPFLMYVGIYNGEKLELWRLGDFEARIILEGPR